VRRGSRTLRPLSADANVDTHDPDAGSTAGRPAEFRLETQMICGGRRGPTSGIPGGSL